MKRYTSIAASLNLIVQGASTRENPSVQSRAYPGEGTPQIADVRCFRGVLKKPSVEGLLRRIFEFF